MSKLLSRSQFKQTVFARDLHKCIFCDKPSDDAHHIIDRKLFADGGYFLSNGASVCSEHHFLCEQTTLSVEQVRDAAGITEIINPPHLNSIGPIDKWGNPILSDHRIKGELFFDTAVQKILSSQIKYFSNYIVTPRFKAIGGSLKNAISLSIGEQQCVEVYTSVVFPECSLHFDNSLIPYGWHITLQNECVLFVWDENNVCLSWDDTREWGELLGCSLCLEDTSATLFRNRESFQYMEFDQNVLKKP